MKQKLSMGPRQSSAAPVSNVPARSSNISAQYKGTTSTTALGQKFGADAAEASGMARSTQSRSNPASHHDKTQLPASTTRALDPDYRFFNGFHLDNPQNQRECGRSLSNSILNQVSSAPNTSPRGPAAENLKNFWNFSGTPSSSTAPGSRNAISRPVSSAKPAPAGNLRPQQSADGSTGSINNIKRVFQKANATRTVAPPQSQQAKIKGHKLATRAHCHSDEQLAAEIVRQYAAGNKALMKQQGTSAQGSGQWNQAAPQVSRNRSSSAASRQEANKPGSHLDRGEFCVSCLFENDSCVECTRVCGRMPLARQPIKSTVVSRSSARAPSPSAFHFKELPSNVYRFDSVPMHISRGECCPSCLFEKQACSNCLHDFGYTPATRQQAVKPSPRPASSQWSRPTSSRNAVVLKPSQSPQKRENHLDRGEVCAACLFENNSCDDCLRACGKLPPRSQQPASRTLSRESAPQWSWKSPAQLPEASSNRRGNGSHVTRGECCITCLFDQDSCDSCRRACGKPPLNSQHSQMYQGGNESRVGQRANQKKVAPVTTDWMRGASPERSPTTFKQSRPDYTDDVRFSPEPVRKANVSPYAKRKTYKINPLSPSRQPQTEGNSFAIGTQQSWSSSTAENGQWHHQAMSSSAGSGIQAQQQFQWRPAAPAKSKSAAAPSQQRSSAQGGNQWSPIQQQVLKFEQCEAGGECTSQMTSSWINTFPSQSRSKSTDSHSRDRSPTASSSEGRDRPSIARDQRIEELASELCGTMRPHKSYMGRTKQSHEGTKAKHPKIY